MSLNIFYIWKKKRKKEKTEKPRDHNLSEASSWEHEYNFTECFSLDPSINTGMSGACVKFCYLETRKAALNMGHDLATKESIRGGW